MWPLWESVHHVTADADRLRSGRYGVIEVVDGRFQAVHLRPWPKQVSLVEVAWLGGRIHRRQRDDRCLLYYNQPLRSPDFLALKYMVSSGGTTMRSLRTALRVLDEIARLKRSDAVVCEVTNRRISDRMLTRRGWEPHYPTSRRRHFIKRFYGQYPPPDPLE